MVLQKLNLTKPKPMESQKNHTYIVQGETFVICCWAYKVVTNLIA
jgi:hypothetical protein